MEDYTSSTACYVSQYAGKHGAVASSNVRMSSTSQRLHFAIFLFSHPNLSVSGLDNSNWIHS